jgi:hypothetical protein
VASDLQTAGAIVKAMRLGDSLPVLMGDDGTRRNIKPGSEVIGHTAHDMPTTVQPTMYQITSNNAARMTWSATGEIRNSARCEMATTARMQ